MRNPKVLLTVIFVLAMIVVGFIFARGPQPELHVPAEQIFSVGGFHITNTIIAAYLTTALLALLSFLATRKAALIPSGFYNFVEAIVEWMLSVVEEIGGARNARKFFPVIATIFLFVISANYLGLLPVVGTIGVAEHAAGQETGVVLDKVAGVYVISPSAKQVKEGDPPLTNESQVSRLGQIKPYLRSANTDVNSTLAIAFWSFVIVEFWGISALGLKYFGKFLAFPPFGKFSPIGVFVGVLELFSEFIRIISFTFRLFGNIFAGDALILFMSFLAPFIIPTVFYGLETFVGFIQAAVFALLTLVFAVMATESHDEGEHEAHGTHGDQAEAAAH